MLFAREGVRRHRARCCCARMRESTLQVVSQHIQAYTKVRGRKFPVAAGEKTAWCHASLHLVISEQGIGGVEPVRAGGFNAMCDGRKRESRRNRTPVRCCTAHSASTTPKRRLASCASMEDIISLGRPWNRKSTTWWIRCEGNRVPATAAHSTSAPNSPQSDRLT